MHTKRLPAHATLGFDVPKTRRRPADDPPQEPTSMPSEQDGWLDDLDDPDLDFDELIERTTVDAYGDEGYWSFRRASRRRAATKPCRVRCEQRRSTARRPLSCRGW